MSARFDERLAAFRHAQEKELEELRYKINALMDRTIKLHQREFDVIPEAWGKLNVAHGVVAAVTSAFQQYPDLDRVNQAQLEDFLNGSFLANWQKDEIRATDKRTDYYQKASTWHKVSEAREVCRDFHIYFRKNGIFIPEPLKSQFSHLDKLTYDAIVEHEINERDDFRPRLRGSLKKLSQAEALMTALEQDVQRRLWSVNKADEQIAR